MNEKEINLETLNISVSRHNFYSFLIHGIFLALAQNFMDIDTIIPSSGGSSLHIGFLTAIMLGGSSFTQLFFAPYLQNKGFKKRYLLLGINSRIASLAGLSLLFFFFMSFTGDVCIVFIFVLITVFSFSGAFANISYTDILGKVIFFSKANIDRLRSFDFILFCPQGINVSSISSELCIHVTHCGSFSQPCVDRFLAY